MPKPNIDTDLLKLQVEKQAEELKANNTPDYGRGFDDACRLLSRYLEELTKTINQTLGR